MSASVTSNNPEIVTRAVEAFGRACTGLALEGVEVVIMVMLDKED